MRNLFILISVFIIFSCDELCNPCIDEDLIGTWLIKSAIGNITDDVINYPEYIIEQTISFDPDNYLMNNCNIRGKYSLKDGSIKFTEFMLTEMFCHSIEFMDWEQMLAQNLTGDCKYEIIGDELQITTTRTYSFRFTKQNYNI